MKRGSSHKTMPSVSIVMGRNSSNLGRTGLRLLGLSLFAFLAACDRTPAPAPPAASGSVQGDYAIVEEAPDTSTCDFCAVPASVKICEVHQGIRTRLHWNFGAQGVQTVDIYVVDEQGKERQFALQPAVGSMQSGPWLRPDLTFVIKNHADGKKLGELRIAGRPC